uniref:HTH CENPB-type domain-containing protein n=1 Tax=Steinernema glaseri TaxID=37863 RepID=A0A1I7ZS84_9BILA
MRLFDLCFHAFLEAEAGLYEYCQSALPKPVATALKRREQSRARFAQLYEERLHVKIPNKCVRYHKWGEIDVEETLKAAAASMEAEDVFKVMVATNAMQHVDKVWELIPLPIKCQMAEEKEILVVRNEAIKRVYRETMLTNPEAACRQCLEYSWVDAALRTYKSMRPEQKTSYLGKAWFSYFFKPDRADNDGDVLRQLLQAKDFDMRPSWIDLSFFLTAKDFDMRPSWIDLSFFLTGYTFEELFERRRGPPIPKELQVPEIEEWFEVLSTRPTGEVPLPFV